MSQLELDPVTAAAPPPRRAGRRARTSVFWLALPLAVIAVAVFVLPLTGLLPDARPGPGRDPPAARLPRRRQLGASARHRQARSGPAHPVRLGRPVDHHDRPGRRAGRDRPRHAARPARRLLPRLGRPGHLDPHRRPAGSAVHPGRPRHHRQPGQLAAGAVPGARRSPAGRCAPGSPARPPWRSGNASSSSACAPPARPSPRIVFRHILPNLAGTIVALGTLQVGTAILVESALSFLGLGVVPPMNSWGSMLASGQDELSQAWWIAFFPGLAITVLVLLVNLLGDALLTHYDPRKRRR